MRNYIGRGMNEKMSIEQSILPKRRNRFRILQHAEKNGNDFFTVIFKVGVN